MNPNDALPPVDATIPPMSDHSQMDTILSGAQAQARQALNQTDHFAGQAQNQAEQFAGQLQQQAAQLAQDLRLQLTAFLNAQKDQAARVVAEIALAAHQIADQLRVNNQALVANAVDGLATRLQGFADNLRQKTLDELLHDFERGAQTQTVLLAAGTLILGLLMTRTMRAPRKA